MWSGCIGDEKLATPQRVIVTAAPGAVFMRMSSPCIEMTPGEAIRLRDVLDRALRVAVAAGHDGGPMLMRLGLQAEPVSAPT